MKFNGFWKLTQSGNNLPHYGVTHCLHLLPSNIKNSKKILAFDTVQHLACFSTHTKFHLSSQIISFLSSSHIIFLFSISYLYFFHALCYIFFSSLLFVCCIIIPHPFLLYLFHTSHYTGRVSR